MTVRVVNPKELDRYASHCDFKNAPQCVGMVGNETEFTGLNGGDYHEAVKLGRPFQRRPNGRNFCFRAINVVRDSWAAGEQC